MGIPAWQLTCLIAGVIISVLLLFMFYYLLLNGRSKQPCDLHEETRISE